MESTPSPAAPESAAAQPRRRPRVWPHALAAVLLTLAGGFSSVLMVDIPWARETGAPSLALMVIGVGYALWTVRRRAGVPSITALILTVALTLFLAFNLYVVKLPAAAGMPPIGSAAPGFRLPDQENRPVALATARAEGPVLLVFYRGHW